MPISADMNLIVPADFTAASRSAVRFATRIAEKTGDKVILLHVYSPPVSKNNAVWPLDAEISRTIMKDTDLQMGRYFNDCLGGANNNCQGKTRVGRLTDEIVIEAAEDTPSMIVMTTSASGFCHSLFKGSNTSGVLESARSPVMIIQDGIHALVPQSVTFATDCQPGDMPAMENLVSLCEKLGAEVNVLHVNGSSNGQNGQTAESFTWRARDITGYEAISCHVVHAPDVLSGIRDYLAQHHSDLLVLTQRNTTVWNRLFQRSLAEKILGKMRTPLLLYPIKNHP